MSEVTSLDGSSGSCCFEPISQELQYRLSQTCSQLEESEIKNEHLEHELARKTREIDNLRCENSQLNTQRQNAEDHSSILATKSDLLKSDLKRHKKAASKLQAQIQDLKEENQILKTKLQKKATKLSNLKAAVRKLESKVTIIETLYVENRSKQGEIERLEFALAEEQRKSTVFKAKLKEIIKSEHEARTKAETVEYLQEQLEKDKSIIRALKSEKLELDLRNRQYETQLSVLNALKSRVTEAAQLEIQVQKLEMENSILTQAKSELDKLKVELDTERRQVKSLREENTRLRQELEDSDTLHEQIKRLESENIILNGKVQNYDLVEQQAKRAPQLSSQIVQLEREKRQLEEKLRKLEVRVPDAGAFVNETKSLKMKLEAAQVREEEVKDENRRLKTMKTRELDEVNLLIAENERMRRQVTYLENEIGERQQREQRLTTKYKSYKHRLKQQDQALHSYESELRSMQLQLSALHDRETMRHGVLSKRHHRTQAKTGYDTSRLHAQLQDIKRQLDSIEDCQ